MKLKVTKFVITATFLLMQSCVETRVEDGAVKTNNSTLAPLNSYPVYNVRSFLLSMKIKDKVVVSNSQESNLLLTDSVIGEIFKEETHEKTSIFSDFIVKRPDGGYYVFNSISTDSPQEFYEKLYFFNSEDKLIDTLLVFGSGSLDNIETETFVKDNNLLYRKRIFIKKDGNGCDSSLMILEKYSIKPNGFSLIGEKRQDVTVCFDESANYRFSVFQPDSSGCEIQICNPDFKEDVNWTNW